MLPTTQFAYRKGLGTCDALFCVSHTLQSALESWQKARIVQIDFSVAFDRVNHQGILYKLCSVGIRGSVLSTLTQFLSIRSPPVMVDGCWSKLDNVSGMLQGSVLGTLFFLLYTSQFFSIVENKLIGYANDFTLMAVVPSPGVRLTVAESLIHKFNVSKTKTMIVSLSLTMHPQ